MKWYQCGGELKSTVTTLHLQKDHQPILMNNVPVKVCEQCGEEYISGPVAEKLGSILDQDREPQTFLSVPLFDFKLAI